MDISNKIILITGGNSGVGREFVRLATAKGAKVIACGRNGLTLSELKKEQPNITTMICDISKDEDILNLKKAVELKYGRIDILVNNAAIINEFDFNSLNFPFSEIENEIVINFTAQIKMIYTFLPLLAKSKSSAIINISSGFAFSPAKRVPVYCATKSALHSFTQSLRNQLKSSNIKIIEAILPLVDTPSTVNNQNKKMPANLAANKILSGISQGKNEIYLGDTKWLPLLLRAAPKLTAKLLRDM